MKPFLTFALCFLISVVAYSQFEPKTGWFVGISGLSSDVRGDFDGVTVLVTDQDLFSIPLLSRGTGVGFRVGRKGARGSWEFTYARSVLDAEWLGARGEAIFSVYSFDFRFHLIHDKPYQPFIQLGWTPVTPLKVKDGAFIGATSTTSDAVYIGNIFNWNGGGGIAFFPIPRIMVSAAAVYRANKYTGIESSQDRVAAEIAEPLKGAALGIIFDTAFIF